jgi:hypothetical protein
MQCEHLDDRFCEHAEHVAAVHQPPGKRSLTFSRRRGISSDYFSSCSQVFDSYNKCLALFTTGVQVVQTTGFNAQSMSLDVKFVPAQAGAKCSLTGLTTFPSKAASCTLSGPGTLPASAAQFKLNMTAQVRNVTYLFGYRRTKHGNTACVERLDV